MLVRRGLLDVANHRRHGDLRVIPTSHDNLYETKQQNGMASRPLDRSEGRPLPWVGAFSGCGEPLHPMIVHREIVPDTD